MSERTIPERVRLAADLARYLRYGAVYGGHVTAYGQSKLRALVEELEALERAVANTTTEATR